MRTQWLLMQGCAQQRAAREQQAAKACLQLLIHLSGQSHLKLAVARVQNVVLRDMRLSKQLDVRRTAQCLLLVQQWTRLEGRLLCLARCCRQHCLLQHTEVQQRIADASCLPVPSLLCPNHCCNAGVAQALMRLPPAHQRRGQRRRACWRGSCRRAGSAPWRHDPCSLQVLPASWGSAGACMHLNKHVALSFTACKCRCAAAAGEPDDGAPAAADGVSPSVQAPPAACAPQGPLPAACHANDRLLPEDINRAVPTELKGLLAQV